MTNRYLCRARVSEHVFRRFLRHVAADLTAVQIAALTGLNRNAVNRLLALLRLRMAEACEAASPFADEFADAADRGNHINGIESFWGYAKTRLARCRGMHPHTFLLHLKECEFRFNHRGDNLYRVLLDLCRRRPLS